MVCSLLRRRSNWSNGGGGFLFCLSFVALTGVLLDGIAPMDRIDVQTPVRETFGRYRLQVLRVMA